MLNDPKGPIEHFSWGKYVVCGKEHSEDEKGQTGVGKDIRLIGEEVTEWKDRKGHLLTYDMITGIYGRGVDVLILGTGVNGALQCPVEVQREVRSGGIREMIVTRTPDACGLYNALYHQGKRVALLAHGTC